MRRQWLVLLLGVGLAFGFTIAYVTKVDHSSEKRNVDRSRDICGIIVLIDDRYQKLDAPDADQQQFITEIHRYRQRLGC